MVVGFLGPHPAHGAHRHLQPFRVEWKASIHCLFPQAERVLHRRSCPDGVSLCLPCSLGLLAAPQGQKPAGPEAAGRALQAQAGRRLATVQRASLSHPLWAEYIRRNWLHQQPGWANGRDSDSSGRAGAVRT